MESYNPHNYGRGTSENYGSNNFQRQYQEEEYDGQYYIAEDPTRTQIAKHFQSSLDQPNLDNVQAKLQAARQRNFQMGKQYYRNKYGTADKFQQDFGAMYRQSGIQQKRGFEQMLYEEADRIKRQQMQKIRRKALGVPQKIRIQQDQFSNVSKQRKKIQKNKRPSNNPWFKQQKSNKIGSSNNGVVVNRNKQAIIKNKLRNQAQQLNSQQSQQSQYRKQSDDEQFQQFVDHVDNDQHSRFRQQRKKSDFLNGFKNYLQNKQHNQSKYENMDVALDKSVQIAIEKTHAVRQKSKQNNNNLKQKGRQSPLFKNKPPVGKQIQLSHEQQLVKKIYKDIIGTSNLSHKSCVAKLQLVQYLISNKRIIKVLGLSQQSLTDQILKNELTKDPHQISYKQFLFYILRVLGKQKQRKILESNWRDTTVPEGCMLNQQIIALFQSTFKKLDKYSDLIVPRIELISKLATDPTIKKLLNSPAVFQKQLQRSISLRRVFERIQLQCLLGNQQQQKSKQYISWQQLINYFTSGHNDKSKYDLIILLQSLKNEQKIGLSDIPQSIIAIFNNVFERLQTSSESRAKQYFNTLEVIEMIRNDPQFDSEKYSMVRPSRSQQTGLGMESLQQVLNRIQETGYKYMNAKQFLQHFSQRGKPIDLLQIQQSMLLQKSFGGTKVRFSQDARKMEQQSRKNVEKYDQNLQNDGGYDSDPQLYNSKLFNGAKRDLKLSPKKMVRSKSKHNRNQNVQAGQTLNSFMIQSQGKRGNSPIRGEIKNQYKITVPEPFKFQERDKQRQQRKQAKKLNRSASVNSEFGKQRKHFQARQIPKKVLEVGLFEKMMQEDQRRQQQRKRTSMLMTLANQQPFSFDTNHNPKERKKAHKKNRQERQQFVFKAKPIPWYCSVNILAKNKETQAERNQKIAKKAQQNLAKARLPPRMEKDFQQKLAKRILEEQRKKDNKGQSQNIFRAKEPPNFNKLHKEFGQQMERKRKDNKTTQIKQFNFSENKPKQVKMPPNDQNTEAILNMTGGFQRKTFSSMPKQRNNQPIANSTAKFNQQCEKRRKQIQQKRRADQQKHRQQLKRQQVNEDLKKKVQQKANTKKLKQKQDLQKRKQQMKADQKNYQQRKQQIIQKARNQPMLMDRPLKRDQKIERMKKLHMISQTLKNNGIKGKEHDTYFKKDQLLLLQDYELLKDKL